VGEFAPSKASKECEFAQKVSRGFPATSIYPRLCAQASQILWRCSRIERKGSSNGFSPLSPDIDDHLLSKEPRWEFSRRRDDWVEVDNSKIWPVGLRPQIPFRISSEGLWVCVAALIGVKLQT
jgi:hypothetical protein